MKPICLEGASAVGKSTTSSVLASEFGFKVIPEVNLMFERPPNESKFWYLEKQIERIHLAAEYESKSHNVILDGDPFQPIWYNNIFEGFQPVGEVIEFYKRELSNTNLSMPIYCVLVAELEDLKKRKEGDRDRQRRNFEKHLSMVSPQKHYFENISSFTAVNVISAKAIDTNVQAIRSLSLRSEVASIDFFLDEVQRYVQV